MRGVVFALIGAVIGPPALLSAYLLLTHGTSLESSINWSWAALIGSVVVGTLLLASIPFRRSAKVVVAIIYVVCASYALVGYALAFVCGAFGRCL